MNELLFDEVQNGCRHTADSESSLPICLTVTFISQDMLDLLNKYRTTFINDMHSNVTIPSAKIMLDPD